MDSGLTAEDGGFHSRRHHPSADGTLIYLPGLHGDWTLLGPFRTALRDRIQLVEFTFPRVTAWDLDDYATAVLDELRQRGVSRGWLLGESFSSQVAWAIARQLQRPDAAAKEFTPQGIILVGGFVRHPMPWGVRLASAASGSIPLGLMGRLCAAYGRLARRRAQDLGGAAKEIDLFVSRRCREDDRRAITGRYHLIRDDDLRPTARAVRWPVYALTGALDPIVPWPFVGRWLRRSCPGFRGQHVIWRAGHNVLLDAPMESADRILSWMNFDRG